MAKDKPTKTKKALGVKDGHPGSSTLRIARGSQQPTSAKPGTPPRPKPKT